MKKARERVWSILLACVMLLTMLPLSVSAEGEEKTVSTEAEFIQVLAEAQDGDTVRLLQDIAMTPPTNITENILYPLAHISSDITLDLNGKKIYYDDNSYRDVELKCTPLFFSVEGGAEVTIKGNGTIDTECGNNNSYGVDIVGNSSVIVENGTFTGATSAFQVEAGQLTIYDGTFIQAETIRTEAPNLAKYVINCIDASFANGTARIYALGGTYCFDPSAKPENSETTYVPEGYTATENADGTYTVAFSGNAIAEINGKPFSSLAVAAEVAQNGDTIQMVDDAQLSSVITIDKAITLDLNGQTITATGISDNANPIQVLEQGKLTIKDSAGQGAIKAKKPLSVERGSLILENGKISVDNNTPNGYGIYVSENRRAT